MSEKQAVKSRSKTIQTRIQSGFMAVVAIFALVIAVSLSLLTVVEQGYKDINEYRTQQCKAQEVVGSHYKWLDALSTSIINGTPFTGSLDPNTCSLGSWLNTTDPSTVGDGEMSQALQGILDPHRQLHTLAAGIVEKSRTDVSGALSDYNTQIKPMVEKVGSGLTIISERYRLISESKADYMGKVVIFSFIVCVGVGFVCLVVSIFYGKSISRKIANPLVKVTEWSEAFATGMDNLNIQAENTEQMQGIVEIERMVHAFEGMVLGLQENVNIIKRVAGGDLRGYVDIRSSGDSLGRNLYHLVQNNDHMFAELLGVSDSVAQNSQSIAEASQIQANQAIEQAKAVENLSETIVVANSLAQENSRRAKDAAAVSAEIKTEMQTGNTQMNQLVQAVGEIKAASERVSGVMKAIDDIAFQTNILALNAAVEAARAGSAGKGFAVVADEVRNLSLKSAEAAKQSSALIENTIQKTLEGSRISGETFEMFAKIVGSTNQISLLVEQIADASASQQEHMASVNGEITTIRESVVGTAASSEETAAATSQMNEHADYIRRAMMRFQLRQREKGHPYIPQEKINDQAFIRQATENYQKAMATNFKEFETIA